MRIEFTREALDRLLEEDEEQIARIVGTMSGEDADALCSAFELWAHESQLAPAGDEWRNWLLMAGRGFGKTRAGAEWVHSEAMSRPGLRVALSARASATRGASWSKE